MRIEGADRCPLHNRGRGHCRSTVVTLARYWSAKVLRIPTFAAPQVVRNGAVGVMAGRSFSLKGIVLIVGQPLPIYLDNLTSSEQVRTSHLGHFRIGHRLGFSAVPPNQQETFIHQRAGVQGSARSLELRRLGRD